MAIVGTSSDGSQMSGMSNFDSDQRKYGHEVGGGGSTFWVRFVTFGTVFGDTSSSSSESGVQEEVHVLSLKVTR